MHDLFSRVFVIGFLLTYIGLFLCILLWSVGRKMRRPSAKRTSPPHPAATKQHEALFHRKGS